MDLSNVRVEENGTAGLSWLGTNTGGFFSTYCLQPIKPQVVTVAFPDGKVHEFETIVSPQCQPFIPIDEVTVSFKPLPGTLGTLVPVGGNLAYVTGAWPPPLQSAPMELFGVADFKIYDPSRYQYTGVDGRVFLIDQAKGLLSVTDPNGNKLTVTPNGIVHSSGRGVGFMRDAVGRISSVTDPDGRSIGYGYDADGNLVTHTDRDANTSTFSYDGAAGLVEIVDPRGVAAHPQRVLRRRADQVAHRRLRQDDPVHPRRRGAPGDRDGPRGTGARPRLRRARQRHTRDRSGGEDHRADLRRAEQPPHRDGAAGPHHDLHLRRPGQPADRHRSRGQHDHVHVQHEAAGADHEGRARPAHDQRVRREGQPDVDDRRRRGRDDTTRTTRAATS